MTVARGQRRRTAWDDQIVTLPVTTGAATSVLLVEDAADPELRGCTMIRTIIGVDLFPDVQGAVTGVQRLTMGIGVASDDAFAAGSLPEPDDQTDYPQGGWVYRASFNVADRVGESLPLVRVDQDLRAARKIDRSSVYLRIQNTAVQGSTFTIQLSGLIRVLYKLS